MTRRVIPVNLIQDVRAMEDQAHTSDDQVQACVVRLPAEVEYSNASQARQELASALAAGAATVIADLTSTMFCDTAGLQEMLQAHKAAVAEGIDLRVVVPARLARLFTVTGLDRVLAVYPSMSAALGAAG